MRTLLFCSLFFIAASLLVRAAPEVVEVREFVPAIEWKTDESLANEPWWPALLATLAPGEFTFEQWQRYHSEKTLREGRMDKERFKAYLGAVRERDYLKQCHEIARVVFIKDADDDYLVVNERIAKSDRPDSGDSYRTLYFKKEHRGWINWLSPLDMSFDSALAKLDIGVPPNAGK